MTLSSVFGIGCALVAAMCFLGAIDNVRHGRGWRDGLVLALAGSAMLAVAWIVQG